LHKIYYQAAQSIQQQIANVYIGYMDKVTVLYQEEFFTITYIHCDNEFHGAIDSYSARQNFPIKMNYVAAQRACPKSRAKLQDNQSIYLFGISPLIIQVFTTNDSKIFCCRDHHKKFPNKHKVSKQKSLFMIFH
jgi:hypothetical protein